MIKNILFDFDGVILDSMNTRTLGFEKIFEDFDKTTVNKLIKYHLLNGGLSRYVKIKYFYEKLLGQDISEENILNIAQKFSFIMKKELVKPKYLINQTMEFIEQNFKKYNLHIVSGSDEKELKYLCKELKLNQYFKSIHGSPTPKHTLITKLMNDYHYNSKETILIGDSINDFEAAKSNGINFYGFNNKNLFSHSKVYLESYEDLK